MSVDADRFRIDTRPIDRNIRQGAFSLRFRPFDGVPASYWNYDVFDEEERAFRTSCPLISEPGIISYLTTNVLSGYPVERIFSVRVNR